MSNTFLLCDMPAYGYEYFNRDDFVHIHQDMSDKEIFDEIKDVLKDKNKLLKKTWEVKEKVLKCQSHKLHNLAIDEIDEEEIKIKRFSFKKNTIIVKNVKEDDILSIKLIMSYSTIIVKSEVMKMLKEYVPNREYLDIDD